MIQPHINQHSFAVPFLNFLNTKLIKLTISFFHLFQQKSRKRKADDTVACPICNIRTQSDDIDVHVELCLKKSEKNRNGNGVTIGGGGDDDDCDDMDDDDDSIDIEGEEYEWAGETRIRASTLLEGGYAGVGKFLVLN